MSQQPADSEPTTGGSPHQSIQPRTSHVEVRTRRRSSRIKTYEFPGKLCTPQLVTQDISWLHHIAQLPGAQIEAFRECWVKWNQFMAEFHGVVRGLRQQYVAQPTAGRRRSTASRAAAATAGPTEARAAKRQRTVSIAAATANPVGLAAKSKSSSRSAKRQQPPKIKLKRAQIIETLDARTDPLLVAHADTAAHAVGQAVGVQEGLPQELDPPSLIGMDCADVAQVTSSTPPGSQGVDKAEAAVTATAQSLQPITPPDPPVVQETASGTPLVHSQPLPSLDAFLHDTFAAHRLHYPPGTTEEHLQAALIAAIQNIATTKPPP